VPERQQPFEICPVKHVRGAITLLFDSYRSQQMTQSFNSQTAGHSSRQLPPIARNIAVVHPTAYPDQAITAKGAAAMLGLSPGTLANWRVQGKGPAHIKLSPGKRGAVRYMRSDIEAWLANGMRSSTSDTRGNARA
jgi:predicted DNA-binding transcriptional regulator AlpA